MSYSNQLKLTFDKIEEGVEMIKKSENYKKYLKVLRLFHNYSYANSLLIYSQCTHAAIEIIAPLKVKVNQADRNNLDEKEVYILKYRSVSVFDV